MKIAFTPRLQKQYNSLIELLQLSYQNYLKDTDDGELLDNESDAQDFMTQLCQMATSIAKVPRRRALLDKVIKYTQTMTDRELEKIGRSIDRKSKRVDRKPNTDRKMPSRYKSAHPEKFKRMPAPAPAPAPVPAPVPMPGTAYADTEVKPLPPVDWECTECGNLATSPLRPSSCTCGGKDFVRNW